MIHTGRRQLSLSLSLALLAPLALAGVAHAQSQGDGFLFRRPSVTLGVRLGYAVPRAGSEVFDFTREQLTVDKSDFNALSFGGELAARVSERFDIALNGEFEKSDTRSEFRDWVDQDDLPIEQSTSFTRVPFTLGVKAYVMERGRRIGQFAWIPRKLNAYVGAGGGIVWYEFEQVGDFVDFDTEEIFFEDFTSAGASPLGYLAAGVDYSLGPRWLVTTEARYTLAKAEMDRDFVGFDDIDLSGLRAAVGISVRF